MRFTLLLSVLLACLGNAHAATLVETLEDYRSLSLGKTALPVSDLKLEVGHLQVTFERGALFPLTTRSGEVLGFVFEGDGLYGYTSTDPSDKRVFAVNLRRVAPLLEPNLDTIWDHFEHAMWFSPLPLVEGLEKAEGPAPGPGVRDALSRTWKRLEEMYIPFDHLAAQARLNGTQGQYVYAEIEGKKETVTWIYDRIRAREETLSVLRKIQGIDIRFPEMLSRQALVPTPGPPVAANLRDAHVEVRTSDNRSGTIDSDLTFESRAAGLRILDLSLMNNRKPESYDWAARQNALRVVRVIGEGGAQLEFSHRYHELLVHLPRAQDAGTRFHIRVETEGEVFTALGGERNDNYFEFFSRAWFPVPQRDDSEQFTFSLKATTRAPWRPVASGATVAFREADGFYELETKSERPIRWPALLAGNYKLHEVTLGNITYRVHAYAMTTKPFLENMPKLADAIVRFYETQLGPCPLRELDLVEVPTYGFGMAPPGMVLMTTEAYKPHRDWIAEYLSDGNNSVLAHEIAHQWFPYLAMPKNATDHWMSESVAEYLAGMAMAFVKPNEARVKGWTRMLAGWQGYAKTCGPAALDTANFMGGEEAYFDRWCLLYKRGPLVMHMFRTNLGDQAFYAVLRKLLDNANGGLVGVEDWKAAQKAVLRTDMSWFFDEWTHKGGVPEVRVTHTIDTSGGKVVLRGRAEQAPASFIKMTIPLVLDYGGGQRDVRVLFQDDWNMPFQFELPAVPKKVTVDPANNNLAVYR